MMKKRFLFVLIAFLAARAAFAQDPIFSQFYAMPLQINPAFAGSSFAPRFGLGYRYQWPGFNTAYRTYALFYEQSIERYNSGIGFHLEGDDAGEGILKTTRFSANYAYQVNINEALAIKIGVEAGAIQTALDWDKLVFPDQIDPLGGVILNTFETRPDQLTRTKLDLSSGMLLYSEKFWAGFSMKHLNTPNETFLLLDNKVNSGLPIRYTVHGGFEQSLGPNNKKGTGAFISPNFLFVSQGPYRQINVGTYLGGGAFFGGLWFRHTLQNADAAIFMAGFRQGVFKMGITYDISVSRLAGISGGTYELTMGFALDKSETLKKKRKRRQSTECPRFIR